MRVRISSILRIILGTVFVIAGAIKIYGVVFAPDVHAPTLLSRSLGERPSMIVAFGAGETIFGVWLLSGVAALIAARITLLALFLFTGAIAAELSKPAPRACGCLGALSAKTPNKSVRGYAGI